MTTLPAADIMDRDLANRLEAVLDADVRPYLQLHAGDIQIEELGADGVLSVRLTGQCARCPAAQDEIGTFITAAIQQALPEVTGVRADTGVSETLLAQARRLLALRPVRTAGSGAVSPRRLDPTITKE